MHWSRIGNGFQAAANVHLTIDVTAPAPSPAPNATQVSEIRPVASFSVESEFHSLASHWRSETRVLSSIHAKVLNKNYQRVMTMGRAVLPLIFRDLRDSGGYWYWALECITGENPAANCVAMADAKKAWLEYAAQHGYMNANNRRN